MTFEIRKAERKKAKIKLGISGPSGSGKTYSALLMAIGMASGDLSKVCVIDTENGSAELYSHLGPYSVITMPPPYSPMNYRAAIAAAFAGKFEIIVIDSASHEWDGEGGCLDMQSKLGGKYQDWSKVTPHHKAFVDTILQTPAHFIVTMRKKQDYEMTSENGKARVQKMGMKDIQREGFEYELTINLDIEMNHWAQASKDRTGIFMPRGTFQISAKTGEELVAWANSGAAEKITTTVKDDPAPLVEEKPKTAVVTPAKVESRYDAHLNGNTRKDLDYKIRWLPQKDRKLSSFSDEMLNSFINGLIKDFKDPSKKPPEEAKEFVQKARLYLAAPANKKQPMSPEDSKELF